MPIILGILLLLGVSGGVIVKSNDSRPGDPFFLIDQTIEKIQLAASDEEGKKKLNAKFAKERLDEVEDLLLEKSEKEDDGEDKNATSTEVSVASSSDDVDNEHIAEGLSFAIDLLGKIENGEQYNELISKLNSLLKDLPDDNKLQIKLSDSDASFLKNNSDDDNSQKIEVEIEDQNGKFKIKTEDDGKVKVESEVKIRNEVKTEDFEDDNSEQEYEDMENEEENDEKEEDDEDENESENEEDDSEESDLDD